MTNWRYFFNIFVFQKTGFVIGHLRQFAWNVSFLYLGKNKKNVSIIHLLRIKPVKPPFKIVANESAWTCIQLGLWTGNGGSLQHYIKRQHANIISHTHTRARAPARTHAHTHTHTHTHRGKIIVKTFRRYFCYRIYPKYSDRDAYNVDQIRLRKTRHSSRKHTYIILTPLNPTLYSKTGVYRGIHYFSYFCSKT